MVDTKQVFDPGFAEYQDELKRRLKEVNEVARCSGWKTFS